MKIELLDYFAGVAMLSLLAKDDLDSDAMADHCYCIADQMVKARKRHLKPEPIKPLFADESKDQIDAVRIYEAYPRKIGKPAAIKAILKALKKVDFLILIDATEKFAELWAGQSLEFCPHPATWFNQERYNDPIELQGPSVPKVKQGNNGIPYGVYERAKQRYEALKEDIQYKYNEERMAIAAEMKELKGIIDQYDREQRDKI